MSIEQLNESVDLISQGQRIFTEKDMKKASRLERIEMYMLQPSLYLSDQDLQYLERLTEAFRLSRQELSKTVVIKKLRAVYPQMTWSTASKVIDESEHIFAPLIKRNRQLNLEVLSQRADKLYKKMVRKKEYKEAVNVLAIQLKIELAKEAEQKPEIWKLIEPIKATFTTNPKALNSVDDAIEEEE